MENAANQINKIETAVGNAAAAQTGSVANILAMRQRIEALANEREAWETTAYARSNELLYGLIQKCYALYIDLTNGKGDVGAKKVGFKDYINSKGYVFKGSTPLTGKIIRCVFGDKDRRRLSTYHTALRVVVDKKWALDEVPAKIAEAGGVQEMSLNKGSGGMTAEEKAKQALRVVGTNELGRVSSDKLAAQNNPEKNGDQAVAVVTQNADGSYTIHCVVHSEPVVKAALASYFGANKEQIAKANANAAAEQAKLTQEQLIANAANEAKVLQAG